VFLETKVWISDYGYDATMHAFDKSAGKLGVEQIDLLIVHQALHPYFTQPAVQAADAKYGTLTQAWSPIGGITFYRETGASVLTDPVITAIAQSHQRTPAQVMLRWHVQRGRSAIPKSTKPARIAQNFDVFDFELTTDQLTAIDALDTGVRRGPEPDTITLETFGREIPKA
jgi:diketogulonate reductase-like aldo/keto reductase